MLKNYSEILRGEVRRSDIERILRISGKEELEKLYAGAYELKLKHRGPHVYFRGLIEISNICMKDCLYCGIRRSNNKVLRYELTDKQVLEEAQFALDSGYGSVVLQGGERSDKIFIGRITRLIREIKGLRKSQDAINRKSDITGETKVVRNTFPSVADYGNCDFSLGITLSLGEQNTDVYREWYDAGARRYLLRIESSNKALYEKIHPAGMPDKDSHSYEKRISAINALKKAGFLTGTGVMIGLPWQSYEDLVGDILFFRKIGVDMVGMGPYIPHRDTPLGKLYYKLNSRHIADPQENCGHGYGELFPLANKQKLELSLKMVAVLRYIMPHINIAATTALQVLAPDGRERALLAGANIIMPNVTDISAKGNYNLYEGKPGLGDDACATKYILEKNLEKLDIPIGWDTLGDWR